MSPTLDGICTVSQNVPSGLTVSIAWWHHQMETFTELLALCAGNSPVTREFPSQRPVTQSFDVFFDMRLNKQLSKQSWGWWFETPSSSLWHHCNGPWHQAVRRTTILVQTPPKLFGICLSQDAFGLILLISNMIIWVKSQNYGCLVTWFCYQLIAKPGNKTAAVPWPNPYTHKFYQSCLFFISKCPRTGKFRDVC